MPPKEKELPKQEESVPQTSTQPPPSPSAKRPLPQNSKTSPAKRQSKWSSEEDAIIINLRGRGQKWDDISKQLPGRSAISCRLHYQNYLERRSEWDEERKDRLARLYERFKQEMWSQIANEMGLPWRAAESMHWHMGEQEMARRAGVVPFSLSSIVLDVPPKKRSPPRRSPSPGAPDESSAPGLLGPSGPSGPSAPQAEAGPASGKEDISK